MLRKVGRNALAIILIQAINFLVPLAALPQISRALGLEAFGLYSIALAYGNYVILFCDFSFNINGPLFVANSMREKTLGAMTVDSLLLKILIALPVSVIFAVCITMATRASFGYVLAGLASALSVTLTPRWIMYGMDKLFRFATASIVTKGMWLLGTYLFIHEPGDMTLLLALTAVTQTLLAGACYVVILKDCETNWMPSRQRVWALFIRDGRQYLAVLSTSSLRDLALIVLSIVTTPAALSLFGLADRVRFAIMSVVAPVSQSLFLMTARAQAGVGETINQRVRAISNAMILFAALLGGVLVSNTAPLIVTLLAGPRFAEAASLLSILAFVPTFTALASILGVNTLLASGYGTAYANTQLRAVAISAPLLCGMAYVFGLKGAAFGALFAEITTSILLLCECIRHGILNRAFGMNGDDS